MSSLDAEEPDCVAKNDIIDVLITPKSKDLGGFSVRRVLPSALARRVGPFVFFDEMGPAQFPPGEGINVRPHPHIGLATVTFLFEGEILHRDSLGYLQAIEPGAVNLMTAGSGIVHSERTSELRLASGQLLHGIQVWMALPADLQEIEPGFVHYPKQDLPVIEAQGHKTTVIIGSYKGRTSPVSVHLETLYLDQRLDQGLDTRLADDVYQRAVYLVSGNLDIDGCLLTPGNMAVITPATQATLLAKSDCHFMVIGGEDVGERHIWWNFVHTSKDRIEQAKKDWRDGCFEKIPDDDEFIPLPE